MELRNNGLLEKHVVDVLKEKKLTITTAESCTGGMISSRIVNVPGASAVLKQAYVTYCDEAKHTVLGVKKETLEKYYAVSSQTACEMAEGGAKAAGADVCVSVTGVAGPDTEDGKPVGCVFIGWGFLVKKKKNQKKQKNKPPVINANGTHGFCTCST